MSAVEGGNNTPVLFAGIKLHGSSDDRFCWNNWKISRIGMGSVKLYRRNIQSMLYLIVLDTIKFGSGGEGMEYPVLFRMIMSNDVSHV